MFLRAYGDCCSAPTLGRGAGQPTLPAELPDSFEWIVGPGEEQEMKWVALPQQARAVIDDSVGYRHAF